MWKLSQKRLFHTMGELQEQRPETIWDRLRPKARMFLKQPNLAKKKLEKQILDNENKEVVQPIVYQVRANDQINWHSEDEAGCLNSLTYCKKTGHKSC